MEAKGRGLSGKIFINPYRYGFNGKEKDDETYGGGNEYDYGMRIYDPRLGRFMSVDPKTAKYSDLSPYSFVGNSPILMIDKGGEEPDRNQAGTIEQAKAQWKNLKNQSINDILEFVQKDPNAVRYVYTEKNGWVDLQHYFGVQKYGKTQMDVVEPASGNGLLQAAVFGKGANESYYSYEDLPTNAFSAGFEKNNYRDDGMGGIVAVEKTGDELINDVEQHFKGAGATAPENAPNWEGIPFKDHGERKRLPETKQEDVKVGGMNVGTMEVGLSEGEKATALKTGKYVPQNKTSKPYNLKGFPAAPSSISKGDTRKGATGH